MFVQRDTTTDVSATTTTSNSNSNSNSNNIHVNRSDSTGLVVSGDASIECIVCYEPFASQPHSRHALVLSCGHTTCRSCVEQLVDHDATAAGVHKHHDNKQGAGRVQCVVCRAQTMLGPDGVKGLKQNTGVAAVVQHMEHQMQQQNDHMADQKRCQGCKGERAVEVLCYDCKTEMCAACFSSTHAAWVRKILMCAVFDSCSS